jgi:hypothetical protein
MPPKNKREAGFSLREVDSLHDVIEEILQIGLDEWESVERQQKSMFPDFGRTHDALRQKFANFYLKKIPTGDPHCPPEVRRARKIYEEIKLKADLSDGGGNGGELDLEQDSTLQPDNGGDKDVDEEDGSEYWDAGEDPLHNGQPDGTSRTEIGQDDESVASIVRARRPPIDTRPEAAGARLEECSVATTETNRMRTAAPNNVVLGNNQTSRMSPFLSNPSSQLSRAGSKRKSTREESEDFSFKDMMRMTMMQRQ